uniref:Uncharacterized protein n=1 Tax=Ciona intestinalis TaxID=7719 RepID=H2Y1M5_CIOIN
MIELCDIYMRLVLRYNLQKVHRQMFKGTHLT